MSLVSNFRAKNPPLQYTEFRWFLLIRFFLVLALFMQITTVFYWIYDLTGSKVKLGLIGLAEVIPAVGMSLLSGHIIDKSEKRKSLLLCILAYFVMAFSLYFFTSPSALQWLGEDWVLTGVFSCIFFGGIVRAFVGPSNFALLGFLLPKEHYANAASWSSMAWQLGGTIGPMLGGVFIALMSPGAAMFAVIICLSIPLISIFQIGKKPVIVSDKKELVIKSIGEGLKFVFNTPVLLGALALDLFSVLFGGAVALLPVFQKDILQVDEMAYGIMRAAPGVGALITLSILVFLPLKTKAGYKLLVSVACFGLSIIVFGISKNIYLSVAMLVLSGMFDAVSVVIRGIILQLVTPEHMRGRVASVNTMFISSSNELGDFESGMMAHWLGPVRAVVVGGMLTIGVVLFTSWKAPTLRRFEIK